MVFRTPSNSVDLRGFDSIDAVSKMWKLIDEAVLKGEPYVIILHGHGTDTLKQVIRSALAKESPYDLVFRPGAKEEGGDGVTVVGL